MPIVDLAEITEDTTTEDIASYAETVAQEVAAERQGTQKTDGEIIADTASAAKTHAEEKSGSDSVLEKDQDEVSGEESEAHEWLNDDVKAEAAAYGIDESDLSEFASREEFDKALRLFDKKVLEAGRKAMAESEDATTRNEKGQFVKKESAKEDADDTKAAKKDGDRYEVALSKDRIDDEIVDEFSRMRDHYETRLERLESFIAHEQTKAEESLFDSLIDSLGHADLFGKSGHESAKELERRKAVHDELKTRIAGFKSLGIPTELNAALVNLASRTVFADEFEKKLLKQQTQKVSKQNQLRQGGSPTRAQPVRESPRDEFDRKYRELDRK